MVNTDLNVEFVQILPYRAYLIFFKKIFGIYIFIIDQLIDLVGLHSNSNKAFLDQK